MNIYKDPLKQINMNMDEILNNIPGGIAVYQVGSTLKTLAYTDGIPRMQGFTREEYDDIVKHDAMNIVYEEDRPLLTATVQRAAETGEQIHLSYRVYCKGGDTIWVNLSAYQEDMYDSREPIYYAIFSKTTQQFNLYQEICDNSSTGALVLDADSGEVFYVNNAMLKMADCEEKPIPRMNVEELFISDMTESEKKMLTEGNHIFVHRLASGKRVLRLHSRRIIWMRRSAIMIYAADVTAEYQKQEELQRRYEEQVNYSHMLSNTAIASSMVNLTKNCIGLQNTELDDVMDIITRQTPQEGFEAMYLHIPDEQIRREYSEIFDTQTIIDNFENGITKKSIRHPYDSYEYWMESSYDAVRNPRTGDLEVYCMAKDVTQEMLHHDVSNMLMTSDYENVFLINPATGKSTMLISGGELLDGNTNECVYYEESIKRAIVSHLADQGAGQTERMLDLNEVITSLVRGQKSYSVAFSSFNEKNRLVRKRISFSYLNKYKSSVICTIQDITADFENELEQREAMQAALQGAQAATKAKANFLANMSHDMRTPMNAILGLSELGMNLNSVEDLKDYLIKINASGKQLLTLINDTLDISRIENGKLIMNLEYIMSRQLLLETVSASKIVAEQKGVNFEIVQDGARDDLLFVDKGKIAKIFANILSNAIKFTPKGGNVKFTVKELSREGKSVNYLLITEDTGVGMSQEYLQHIYEPFSQERCDYDANLAGTGLGMAIVKELIDFLGGRIEIKSEKNKGTKLSVWISFRIAECQPEVEKKTTVTYNLRGIHILLAEDHSLNAEIAQEILKNMGCAVTWAKGGKECCDIFEASEPGCYDAILMDIRMPGRDGLEATQIIRAMDREDAGHIPIIALSANAYSEDVEKSLRAGMNAHLSKPISTSDLYEVLSRFCDTMNSKTRHDILKNK